MAGLRQSLPPLPALSGSPGSGLLPSFRVRLAEAFAAPISWVLKVQARLYRATAAAGSCLCLVLLHALCLLRLRLPGGIRACSPCSAVWGWDMILRNHRTLQTHTFTGVQTGSGDHVTWPGSSQSWVGSRCQDSEARTPLLIQITLLSPSPSSGEVFLGTSQSSQGFSVNLEGPVCLEQCQK